MNYTIVMEFLLIFIIHSFHIEFSKFHVLGVRRNIFVLFALLKILQIIGYLDIYVKSELFINSSKPCDIIDC